MLGVKILLNRPSTASAEILMAPGLGFGIVVSLISGTRNSIEIPVTLVPSPLKVRQGVGVGRTAGATSFCVETSATVRTGVEKGQLDPIWFWNAFNLSVRLLDRKRGTDHRTLHDRSRAPFSNKELRVFEETFPNGWVIQGWFRHRHQAPFQGYSHPFLELDNRPPIPFPEMGMSAATSQWILDVWSGICYFYIVASQNFLVAVQQVKTVCVLYLGKALSCFIAILTTPPK